MATAWLCSGYTARLSGDIHDHVVARIIADAECDGSAGQLTIGLYPGCDFA